MDTCLFKQIIIGTTVAGGWMLCLDNSSTMALVQLELLHQIEKATGKKITELFRWIVASGIGGLLMLIMVYGKLQCILVSDLVD